jgi:hypothetical protein
MYGHKAFLYALLFSGATIAAGYVHEIGHAAAGLLVAVITVPTPAKEYVLQSQLEWSKEIWIALGGPIGTLAATISALFYFWHKPCREREAVLFGAIVPLFVYSVRFLSLGRGHDGTEWQAAQTALCLPPASHTIDIVFFFLLIAASVVWLVGLHPSFWSFLRFPALAVAGVVLLIGLQEGNNAVFDRVFPEVKVVNVPSGLDPR